MSDPRPLHRLFDLSWSDYVQGTTITMESEMDLSLKQQFLDLVLIRKSSEPIPKRMPDGFEDLAIHNITRVSPMISSVLASITIPSQCPIRRDAATYPRDRHRRDKHRRVPARLFPNRRTNIGKNRKCRAMDRQGRQGTKETKRQKRHSVVFFTFFPWRPWCLGSSLVGSEAVRPVPRAFRPRPTSRDVDRATIAS
jgi:hypothetical protein